MAYGFQVFSANGATLIDTSDPYQILYQEFASGTSGAVSGANLLNFKEEVVTVTGYSVGECLVFIRPTGTVAGVGAYVVPSTTGFSIWSDSNTSFYWYVFKKASSLSAPTGYGLVVYAANGTDIQYTGDTLTTRIRGRITGSGTVTGSNLFGLGTYQYSRVTQYSFRRGNGDVYGWIWKWSSTGLNWSTSIIKVGQGFTSAIGAGGYVNLSEPSVLVIEAPNP